MALVDSYKNPFQEYNANTMVSNKILNYWCSPFHILQSLPISEKDIFKDGNPIIFMGGRGTGKTMFLRYYSYEIQRDEALTLIKNGKCKSILEHLKNKGGIGFYLRIDGPILRSFQGKGLNEEKWDSIFTHYFELQVAKLLLDVINDLVERDEINGNKLKKGFLPKVAKLLRIENLKTITIENLINELEDQIEEVNTYRGDIAFSDFNFCPKRGGHASQRLSFGIPIIAKQYIDEFKDRDLSLVLLIDEYENFLEQQQKMVNALLKFVKSKEGTTIRIGMRLKGFKTTDTINEDEFIKEGRDYTNVIFEHMLIKNKKYNEYLIKIAEKRLVTNPIFREKQFLDIRHFLGKKEDLEKEAKEIAKGGKKHFNYILNLAPNEEVKQHQNMLEYSDNPLLEMLNLLWILRDRTPEETKEAMEDFLNKKETKLGRKYHYDYINKYKLSLTFLLATTYKTRKQYYSFNTFAFLSSGIVGNFIELCRRSFQFAYFEEQNELLENGIISKYIQDKAAHEVANSELEMITRIRKYGDYLYHFTKNVGNIFSEYHKDPYLRYPETNQFCIDVSSLEEAEIKKAFDTGIEWSVIQKKPILQRATPSSQRTDLYMLNRIYSPIFDITYRIRGGFSETYEPSQVEELMKNLISEPKKDLKMRTKKETIMQTDISQRKIDSFQDGVG